MIPVGSPQTPRNKQSQDGGELEPLLSEEKNKISTLEDEQSNKPTTQGRLKRSHRPEQVVSSLECAGGVGLGIYAGVKIYSDGESESLLFTLSAGVALFAAGVFGLIRAFTHINDDKIDNLTEIKVDGSASEFPQDDLLKVAHEVNQLYQQHVPQNGTVDLLTERDKATHATLNHKIKAVVESLLEKIRSLETSRPTQFIEMTNVSSIRKELENELEDTKSELEDVKRRLESARADIEQFEIDLADAKESISFYEVQLSDLRSTIADLAKAHEENDMESAKSILSQADSTLSQTRSNISRGNVTSSRLSRTSLEGKGGLSPVQEKSGGEKSVERFLDDDSE